MALEDIISNEYVRALVLFVIYFFVFKIALKVLEKITLKLTTKTKTDLDDIIIKKASGPVNFLSLLLALRLTINEISSLDNIESYIHNSIFTLFIIVVAYLIFSLSDVLISRAWGRFAKKTKTKVDDTLASLLHEVIKIALILITLLYILSIWGVEILPLLGALGVAGIAIALALQPTLSNVFSGASVILDKTINKGDLIYLDQNTKGKIEKVGLRSTKIITFDNELIIVPNSKLADSIVQNVALPEPKTRVVVPFSVAYGSDIEKVKKVVMKEVLSVKNLEKEPEPLVRFLEMADSSLNFKAYFYVDSFENKWSAIDEVNTKIYNALNKNKIEIPFPQMDVHLKKK